MGFFTADYAFLEIQRKPIIAQYFQIKFPENENEHHIINLTNNMK